MPLDVLQPALEDRAQPLRQRSLGGHCARERRQVLAVAGQEREVQVPLGVEMAIEDGLGDPRRGGDVVETRPVIAALAEQPASRLRDQLPPLGHRQAPPLLHRAHSYRRVTYVLPYRRRGGNEGGGSAMTSTTSTTQTPDGRPANDPGDGSGLERVPDPVHHVAYGFEHGD